MSVNEKQEMDQTNIMPLCNVQLLSPFLFKSCAILFYFKVDCLIKARKIGLHDSEGAEQGLALPLAHAMWEQGLCNGSVSAQKGGK